MTVLLINELINILLLAIVFLYTLLHLIINFLAKLLLPLKSVNSNNSKIHLMLLIL